MESSAGRYLHAADVPVSHICRSVENELLDLLRFERRPVNEAGSATILI